MSCVNNIPDNEMGTAVTMRKTVSVNAMGELSTEIVIYANELVEN